jgi:hypothetical protein
MLLFLLQNFILMKNSQQNIGIIDIATHLHDIFLKIIVDLTDNLFTNAFCLFLVKLISKCNAM